MSYDTHNTLMTVRPMSNAQILAITGAALTAAETDEQAFAFGFGINDHGSLQAEAFAGETSLGKKTFKLKDCASLAITKAAIGYGGGSVVTLWELALSGNIRSAGACLGSTEAYFVDGTGHTDFSITPVAVVDGGGTATSGAA